MIDKTILDNARSIDLIDFLERYKGFHFRNFGTEYRPTEHTSLAVKRNRLSWYWHSKGIGGYGAKQQFYLPLTLKFCKTT